MHIVFFPYNAVISYHYKALQMSHVPVPCIVSFAYKNHHNKLNINKLYNFYLGF